MTKLLLIVTTTFLAFGCGKKPAPQPVVTTPPPPPPARPAEAAPFTVSYTYKGKADTSGLLYTVSSDGAAAATVASPPKRYLGKALPEYVKDLAELLADPELRAIPLRTENGPLPIVEVELIDAKGVIWRRYIAGDPPAAARPLM